MSLQSLIQQHRAALLARDKAAAQEMTRYYDAIWQRIYTRLNELLAKMQDAQNAGKDIKVSWLYEQDRLQTLLPQVAQQFNVFARQAELETRNLSTLALHIGAQDAQSLLSRAFLNDAGINITFNRLPQEAIRDMIGSFSDGSPVAKLFAGFGEDAAQTVKNALISGVALGKNPRIIAKDIQQALGQDSLSRALVIAQDQSIKAYRNANLVSFQANSDVVSKWRWDCDKSPRTCAVCLAMDGTEHSLDETLDSHVGCRCAMLPITKSWAELGFKGIPETNLAGQSGADYFANLSTDQQDNILGKAAGAAYRRGDVNLQDFVGVKHDREWGTSRYQKSAKQLGIAS